jgi:tetraacyldisaccharide 4'-kinase
MVLFTRCDQVEGPVLTELREEAARFAPNVPLLESTHRPMELRNSKGDVRPLSELARRPVGAFCGVGNPGSFRQTLLGLEAEVTAFRVFPDHHTYTRDDVEDLRAWASRLAKDCVIVTTQKDLVKLRLPALGSRPLWAVRIGLYLQAGQAVFDRKLQEVLPPTAQS